MFRKIPKAKREARLRLVDGLVDILVKLQNITNLMQLEKTSRKMEPKILLGVQSTLSTQELITQTEIKRTRLTMQKLQPTN